MRALPLATAAAALAVAGLAAPALANKINTGGATGSYHSRFCPLLKAQLDKAQLKYDCATSAGSRENISRVWSDPKQIGYSQLDIFALEKGRLLAKDQLQIARSDDVRECLFLVTRNKQFTAYGDVQAYADKLRFILPPKESGSAATFDYLRQIDTEGLARVQPNAITYAKSADDAIKQALSAEDTMALFVQVPDPASPLFKTINELGGQMLPVVDRTILRQQIDGQKVYFAEETEVAQAKWVSSGKKVVTACTPMVVFTGDPNRLDTDKARQEQKDVIATIQQLKVEDVVPKKGFLQTMLKRTKEISAQSAEKLMEMSEKARVAAKPAMEKAKEMGAKAIEAAKPAMEKAKEATEKAVEKAKEAMSGQGQPAPGGGATPAPAPATPAPAPSPPAASPPPAEQKQ